MSVLSCVCYLDGATQNQERRASRREQAFVQSTSCVRSKVTETCIHGTTKISKALFTDRSCSLYMPPWLHKHLLNTGISNNTCHVLLMLVKYEPFVTFLYPLCSFSILLCLSVGVGNNVPPKKMCWAVLSSALNTIKQNTPFQQSQVWIFHFFNHSRVSLAFDSIPLVS